MRISKQVIEGSRKKIGELILELCTALYHEARPWVIACTSIDELADSVHTLNAESITQRLLKNATLGKLASKLLEDLKIRLIYRAQVYIRDEITTYSSVNQDLRYYDHLQALKIKSERPSDNTKAAIYSAAELYRADWSPVLDRTLTVLSKIYRCLESNVFEDIAHNAVVACIRSLVKISKTIAACGDTKGRNTSRDLLFLIKHLLILREQISPFETELRVMETQLNFTHMADIVPALLSQRYSLVRALQNSIPTVVEKSDGARELMEEQLKRACENFISTQTNLLVQPVFSLLSDDFAVRTKSEEVHPRAAATVATLQKSGEPTPTASPSPRSKPDSELAEKTRTVIDNLSASLVGKVEKLKKTMTLYLENPTTERVLLKPVLDNVRGVMQRLKKACKQTGVEVDFQPCSDILLELRRVLMRV